MILTFALLLMVNRRLVVDLEQDIVRREQAEEALKSSEEKFHKAFHSSPDAILISKLRDGQLVEVNDGFTFLTGYLRQEALVSSSLNLRLWVNSQDRDLYVKTLQECQRVHEHEYDFRTKSGNIRHGLFSGEIIKLGNEPHILTVVRDVTEHKERNEILRRRTDVLAALHQVTLDLVNRHDVDEILQALLAKTTTLLNVQQVSIDLIENEDTLVTYAATPGQPLTKGDRMRRGEGGWLSWQAIESGTPAILDDYSTWPQRRELYEGFALYAVAIIPIPQGDHIIGAINISRNEPDKPFSETEIYVGQQLAQMVALVLDNAQLYAQLHSELAERRRIEENLRESRENFQRYFNMSTVGMCVTAPDRRWIEANGRLRQMLGYSAEELDNLTWSELTHPDDLDADLMLFNQIMANQRDSYQLDKRFIRKDGAIIYTTIYVSCYRNSDGSVRYCLASLVDITSRKLAEDSLLKLAAMEERQRLARDLHDSVNQSVHGLVLFSETLASTLEKNNTDRARQIADRLQESARQALKETRLMLYEMQTIDPERSVNLVQDLELRLVTVERRAGIRAHIIQEGSLEHCPPAWHENLFWITIEALNNALKHAQARSMQIRICSFPTRMEIEVIDDGVGFDAKRPRPGGLGLQNMRDRASLLGGELTIHSRPKKGSRVCFRAEIKD
jgi:PAS domain S-box-containing protein